MFRPHPAVVLLAFPLFLIAGCGGSSSTGSGPTNNPQLSLSATTLSFGSVTNGQTSPAQTLTLTNTGTAALSIPSITLTGDSSGAFAETTTCGSSLAANTSCGVSVTFKPTTVASYSATITITDSAAGSPQTVTLSGTGTAVPVPAVTLSTASLSFTATQAGVASAAQTVTVTNSGNGALGNLSIAITGTNAAQFAQTSTCTATLAAATSCTVSVVFTAASANGSYSATLQFTDNATNSPQTVTLTGVSASSGVSLSLTNVAFVATPLNTTSQPTTVTLTNTGGLTLNISSIILGGTNPGDFAETNTCGSTLAKAASCTFSITFTPLAANTYSATITITDDAATSPQTITLTGTGTSSTVSYHMYVLPDPGSGAGSGFLAAMQQLIAGAQKTIDMTMYELEDTNYTGWLTAACTRGVVVRVIMDQGELSVSGNKSTFNTLNSSGANCSAVASNKAFANTHQKTMTVDGTTTVIMSLNLQSQYYTTTRDFAMVENDPLDIAAIEATFAQDYAAGTPSGGTAGPSDLSYLPGPGDDLIWSPTTAKPDMISIIQNAKSTLLLENEELASSATYIISALTTACQNGVKVSFAIVDDSDYEPNFTTLKNAGCGIHTIPDTTSGFYIHAKAVVADYGLPTQSVYMGSINYSNGSMTSNRELGMYVTDQPSIDLLYNIMSNDYANATPW